MTNWKKMQEELNERTRVELREMCAVRNIHVNTKTTKDVLISKLIESMQSSESGTTTSSAPTPCSEPAPAVASPSNAPISNVKSKVDSYVTPSNTFKSFVRVSCGAASDNFQVVGKTVTKVAEFLREALNIDEKAQPIVNGESVSPSYVLKEGDTVEYVKLAGKKG